MVPAAAPASATHPCGFLRASVSATALEETQILPTLDTGIPSPVFRSNLTTAGPANGSDMAFENAAEYFTCSGVIQAALKGMNPFLHPQAQGVIASLYSHNHTVGVSRSIELIWQKTNPLPRNSFPSDQLTGPTQPIIMQLPEGKEGVIKTGKQRTPPCWQ